MEALDGEMLREQLEAAHRWLDILDTPRQNASGTKLTVAGRVAGFCERYKKEQRLAELAYRWIVWRDVDRSERIYVEKRQQRDGSYKYVVCNELGEVARKDLRWFPDTSEERADDDHMASTRLTTLKEAIKVGWLMMHLAESTSKGKG